MPEAVPFDLQKYDFSHPIQALWFNIVDLHVCMI